MRFEVVDAVALVDDVDLQTGSLVVDCLVRRMLLLLEVAVEVAQLLDRVLVPVVGVSKIVAIKFELVEFLFKFFFVVVACLHRGILFLEVLGRLLKLFHFALALIELSGLLSEYWHRCQSSAP